MRTLENIAWVIAPFIFLIWFVRYLRKPLPVENQPTRTPRVPVTGDLFA